MTESNCKGRVIINPDMHVTDDDICFTLFGMSLYNLAQEIRHNKDGKYDELYEEGTPDKQERIKDHDKEQIGRDTGKAPEVAE